MIGKLARIGVMGWLANKAYKQWVGKPTLTAAELAKHMEVVGSDGGHVGTIDNLAIKLTRTDPTAGGRHHLIPWAQASGIRDGKLVLNVTASEAVRTEKSIVE